MSENDIGLAASVTAVLRRLRPQATDLDTTVQTLDSLGLAELVAALEDELEIFIPDAMLDDKMFSSVRALSTSLSQLAPTDPGQPAS